MQHTVGTATTTINFMCSIIQLVLVPLLQPWCAAYRCYWYHNLGVQHTVGTGTTTLTLVCSTPFCFTIQNKEYYFSQSIELVGTQIPFVRIATCFGCYVKAIIRLDQCAIMCNISLSHDYFLNTILYFCSLKMAFVQKEREAVIVNKTILFNNK